MSSWEDEATSVSRSSGWGPALGGQVSCPQVLPPGLCVHPGASSPSVSWTPGLLRTLISIFEVGQLWFIDYLFLFLPLIGL